MHERRPSIAGPVRCDGDVAGQTANLSRPVAMRVRCPRDATKQVVVADAFVGVRTECLCAAHAAGARRRRLAALDVRDLDAPPLVVSDELRDAARSLASTFESLDEIDRRSRPRPTDGARRRELTIRYQATQQRVNALLGDLRESGRAHPCA